jgi:hypothetical protein
MSSENPQYTGEADPVISKAYYRLLHAAIVRSGTVGVIGETGSALEEAAIEYAKLLPKAVKEMIARKVAAAT